MTSFDIVLHLQSQAAEHSRVGRTYTDDYVKGGFPEFRIKALYLQDISAIMYRRARQELGIE
jgi:hypothetical protein